jgi:hypothetical protein
MEMAFWWTISIMIASGPDAGAPAHGVALASDSRTNRCTE